MPWLKTVGGVACVAFLLAIVTGVLIHLKDLVRQFCRIRWRGRLRVLWSDLHKTLGVTGLPFQIFFAFTSALLSFPLIALLTPLAYPGNGAAAERAVWGSPRPNHDSATRPKPSLGEVLDVARAELPGLEPQYLNFEQSSDDGDDVGTVTVKGPLRDVFNGRGEVVLRRDDAKVLDVYHPSASSPTQSFRRALFGVHFVNFGGSFWKILFALFSLATCVTIVTGNLVWLARRRSKGTFSGNWALERLTVATGAGLALATGALFAGSRLLAWFSAPPSAGSFLLSAWLVSVLWAFASRSSRAAWFWQLATAGLLFGLAPLLAAVESPAGLLGSGPAIGEVAGTDVGLLTIAATLATTAWWVRKERPDRGASSAAHSRAPNS